jgi:polysaccharide biosynthesis transport protein
VQQSGGFRNRREAKRYRWRVILPIVRRRKPISSGAVAARPELWKGPHHLGYVPAERTDDRTRYWAILRRHRTGVLIIFFLCILGSLVVTLLSAPVYGSKALLEVMAVNRDFMNNKDIDPNVSSTASDGYIATQTKLLMSDAVSDRVVTVLLPTASIIGYENDGGISKLRRWLHLAPPKPRSAESVVREMLSRIKVKPEGESSLISLTVYGPTPKLTADTANALAEQDIIELQEGRWTTATRTGEFLTRQIGELKNKLQTSEDQLQDYARKVGLVYTSDTSQSSVAEEKLRQIQQDLERAESDSADKQSQLELVKSTSPDTLPRVLDDGSLRADKEKITDLRRQLADLRTTLTPNHYKVKQVQSQIEELQTQAEQERITVVKRIENDYRAAARRLALLSDAYSKQLALVSQQSAQGVRYNMLKHEVDANRDMYQSMLQKVKEAGVIAALRETNIRIVDRAKPPSRPFRPNIAINVGIGVLTACMLALLFILLRERSNQSIRTPGESAKLLDVPELATIPSGKREIRAQLLLAAPKVDRNSAALETSTGTRRHGSMSAPRGYRTAEVWVQNESLVAESFRSAVTSILLWGNKGQNQIIVVTSAHSKAGKTTVVFNLGMSLAESGRRVLLIDGDLRRSMLGPIFGFNRASGLSNILAENFNTTTAKDLIRNTPCAGLFILPSGSPGPSAARLLHSARLPALVSQLRSEFDFILIDSAPTIPMADARLLAQHADGVILICRAGQTSVEQLVSIRKSFYQDGVAVIGTILNDWDARTEDPAYVQSYSRYYKAAGSA